MLIRNPINSHIFYYFALKNKEMKKEADSCHVLKAKCFTWDSATSLSLYYTLLFLTPISNLDDLWFRLHSLAHIHFAIKRKRLWLGHFRCFNSMWVMSYSTSNPENYSSATATNSPELKLYQAFIFSVPICFTFIVLFLFYLVYLRRSSADLSSLGMRSAFVAGNSLSMVL